MDDPLLVRAPNGLRNRVNEAGLDERVADFGAKDSGQGEARDEETWVLGMKPTLAVRRQAASGDEEMGVRMKEHRASPGVKDSDQARSGAEELRIGSELEQRRGSRLHEDRVDRVRMSESDRAELRRQREGQQVVGHRQQAVSLCGQPSAGVFSLALGTVPVTTGVEAVSLGVAVVTNLDVTAEGRGTALLDVAQGLALG